MASLLLLQNCGSHPSLFEVWAETSGFSDVGLALQNYDVGYQLTHISITAT